MFALNLMALTLRSLMFFFALPLSAFGKVVGGDGGFVTFVALPLLA